MDLYISSFLCHIKIVDSFSQSIIVTFIQALGPMVRHRSPKPMIGGSSPSAPASKPRNSAAFFYFF